MTETAAPSASPTRGESAPAGTGRTPAGAPSPAAVEALLRAHPRVRDVAVVEVPAPDGARLAAYLVPIPEEPPEAAEFPAASRITFPNGMRVVPQSRVEAEHFYEDLFEKRIYLRHGVSLAPGDTVVDVGGNIGLFTLFAASVPGTRVYTFEPAPPLFRRIRANLALNGLRATLFPCGVSDRPGEAEFTFYPQSSGMSSFHPDAEEEREVLRRMLEIEARDGTAGAADLLPHLEDLLEERFAAERFTCALRTLSEVFRAEGIERIDLLKVDVQKAELAVLQGVSEEDWPRIRQVAAEVHDLDGRLEAVVSLLRGHGFAVAWEQDPAVEGTVLYNLFAVRPDGDAAPCPPRPAALPRLLDDAALPAGLGAWLAARLPDGAVPALAAVDALPWTETGAVDPDRLPPLPADALRAAPPPRPPETDPVAVVGVAERASAADRFDAAFFGIPAEEAARLDPHHRIFLECAWEALESAGRDPARAGASPVGVFAGTGPEWYLFRNVLPALEAADPERALRAAIASDADPLAAATARRLGLAGPAVTLRTGEASALAPLHLACRALLEGACDLALAGSAMVAAGGGYLSDSSGNVPEGRATVVALRRLEDALAEGDPIRAVVLGSTLVPAALAPDSAPLPERPASTDAAVTEAAAAVRALEAAGRSSAAPARVALSVGVGAGARARLEAPPPPPPTEPGAPWELLLLSGRTPTAADAAAHRLADHLRAHPELSLADVAFTLREGRSAFPHRIAVVAGQDEDAASLLEARLPGRTWAGEAPAERPRIVFLFPGLGEQYPGMGRGLYASEPVFREAVDRCAEALLPGIGVDLREALFPPEDTSEEGGGDGGNGARLRWMPGREARDPDPAAARLSRTELAHPAVFVVGYALAKLWESRGIVPDAVIGHSLGEYTAACIAGVMEPEEALALVAERARLLQSLPEGAMLAVSLPEAELAPFLRDGVTLAAANAPALTVAAGPPEAVEALRRRLEGAGHAARRLPTTHAFHSPMMAPAAERLAARTARLRLSPPRIPLVSNLSGAWLTPEEAVDPGYWARHLVGTVRFEAGARTLLAGGGAVAVEVGPGQSLGTFLRQSVEGAPAAIPSLRHAYEETPDAAHLLGALGRLWIAGADFVRAPRGEGAPGRRVPLPTYPFEPERHWIAPGPGVVPPAAGAGSGDAVSARPRSEPLPAEPLPAAEPPAEPDAAADTRAQLAGIWRDLLGVAPTPDDDFFLLGGHSLVATRLIARVREAFGVELRLRAIFRTRTLRAMAELIAEAEAGAAQKASAEAPAEERIVPLGGDGRAPLSFSQERLWILEQLRPGTAVYNLPFAVRLSGPLRLLPLERALAEVTRRHDALRTVFETAAGRPVARTLDRLDTPLAVEDLSELPPDVRREAAERRVAEESRRPFTLRTGPLFRCTLLRLSLDEHLLLLMMHHIVGDGWSLGVLSRELGGLYGAFARGEPSPLPPLSVQYGDYAAWQRRHLSGTRLREELEWWEDALRGAPPVLDLPTDRLRPELLSPEGGTLSFRIPAGPAEALRALAREEKASLFMVLLALYALLLHRRSGALDVVVGTPVANRTRPEVEGLIGFFVNTLALRVRADGDPSFRDLVGRARHAAQGAFDHAELPFERLVDHLQAARALNRNPIFQTMLVFQNLPEGAIELGEGVRMEPVAADSETAKFDLTLAMQEAGEEIAALFEYPRDLFDAATVAGMAEELAGLAAAVAADPEARLSTLAPLPAEAEPPAEAVEDAAGDEGAYPLTPYQAWCLHHYRALGEPGAYVVVRELRLRGRVVDPVAFREAWTDVVAATPALRSSMEAEDGGAPRQVVHPRAEAEIVVEDWRALPGAERSRRIEAYVHDEHRRGIDPGDAPRLRVALLRTGTEEYEMLWTASALFLDRWSAAFVVERLFAAYEARVLRSVPALPAHPPFRALVERLHRADPAAAEAHWRAVLAGFAHPTPVADRTPSPGAASGVAAARMPLPRPLTAGVERLARERGLPLRTLFAAAWARVLAERSGTDDVLFGSLVSARGADGEMARVVGSCVNLLPLRLRLPAGMPADRWLRAVHDAEAALRRYADADPLRMREWSGVPPGSALFESVLSFETPPPAAEVEAPRGWRIEEVGRGAMRSAVPLRLEVVPGAEVAVTAHYREDALHRRTVTALLDRFGDALAALVAAPEAPLGSDPFARGG